MFEGILTVEMVDKQNEVTIVDELMKALPIWMARGGPISDTHSNRIIGKGVRFLKTTVTDSDGTVYPAISIQGEIFKDYELDNEIWEKIKSGEYKGLSFGGATRSDRIPITNKDGTTSYALHDLEQYEIAVCEDPAVPLALITQSNKLAKAMNDPRRVGIPQYTDRGNGQVLIRCSTVGCYIEKNIKKFGFGTGGSSTTVAADPVATALKHPEDGKQEWTSTDGVNRPQKESSKRQKEMYEAQRIDDNTEPSRSHEGAIRQGQGESTPRQGGGLDLSRLGKDEKNKIIPAIAAGLAASAMSGEDDMTKDDDEDVEKLINPGENLLTEKPIRGIRGTGGERAFDSVTGKSDKQYLEETFKGYLEKRKLEDKAYLDRRREEEQKAVNQGGQYDMNGIDRIGDDMELGGSPTEKEPKESKEKDATPPSLSGVNSEDGVNGKLRVTEDPPADALKVDNVKKPEGGGSGAVMGPEITGEQGFGDVGAKGSYDTFIQDTGDSRQAHAGRNTKLVDAGMTDVGLGSSDKSDDDKIDLETVKMRLKLMALKSI